MAEAAKACKGEVAEKAKPKEEYEYEYGKKPKKDASELLQEALKEASLDRIKELISAALEALETKKEPKEEYEYGKPKDLSVAIEKTVKKVLKSALDERFPVTRKGLTSEEEPGETVQKKLTEVNKIKDPELRLKALLKLQRGSK